MVWLRLNEGAMSLRLPKWVKDKLGRPQSKGFCETPLMPRLPVMSCENAKRFFWRVRLVLNSTRALLFNFPILRVYERGTSQARKFTVPPMLGNGLVSLLAVEW